MTKIVLTLLWGKGWKYFGDSVGDLVLRSGVGLAQEGFEL